MVYGSGVGVFATSHGAQPVGDPCIDDGVAADCQLGGFLVQFADHPCGHRQRDSLLQRGMMFDYGIAEIDIAEDVVAVVEHPSSWSLVIALASFFCFHGMPPCSCAIGARI